MKPSLDLLHIETTTDCNLRCRHCAIRKEGYRIRNMEMGVFERCLPVVQEYKPMVNLSGHGETLVHPYFWEMFESTAGAGARGIEFQTNGHLLTPELTERLLRHNVWERLKVSLDGATEETYRWVRGVSLEKVAYHLFTFQKLRGVRKRPGLTVEFCCMKQNIAEMADVVLLGYRCGADCVIISDLREYPATKGQSMAKHWKVAEPHYDKAVAEAKALGVTFRPSGTASRRLGLEPDKPTKRGKFLAVSCTIPWTVAFVDVAGKVRPCCAVDDVLGDLRLQTFEDAWLGENATRFRKRFAEGKVPKVCESCTFSGR